MDVSEFLKTGAIRTQRLRPLARGRVSLLTPLLRHVSHLESLWRSPGPARPFQTCHLGGYFSRW